jgi:hypothetical protein
MSCKGGPSLILELDGPHVLLPYSLESLRMLLCASRLGSLGC